MIYLNRVGNKKLKKKKRPTMTVKKVISLIVIIAFLFHMDVFLRAQSEDEIVSQFHRAKERYIKQEYSIALVRLQRLIGIIEEKNIDRKDILGMCHLLLGAIHEKETNEKLAEEHYRKAREIYGITLVDGVNLEELPLFRKTVEGEGQIIGEGDGSGGTIEKPGQKKKKKFPWLLVAGGVVVVTILIILLTKKKKKYDLSVNLGEGVNGSPETGVHTYNKGTPVAFNYTPQAGYGNLTVTLDGSPAATSGTIVMNGPHTLSVTAQTIAFVTDKDAVEVPEKGTATFSVRLSAFPQGDVHVTVTNVEGDQDIQVSSGSVLTFTQENWDEDQIVTLSAKEDTDATADQATIRIEALGGEIPSKDIIATEVEVNTLEFVTNKKEVTVEEKSNGTFKVKLSSQPDSTITATVTWISGDTDISVKDGSPLIFTSLNWDTYQTVTLEAAEDTDTSSGEAIFRISTDAPKPADKDIKAIEIDINKNHFVTNPSGTVIVEEKGETSVQVKLSNAPSGNVIVSVTKYSGDESISVSSGGTLTFNTSNWDQYQQFTLAAAEDTDGENGEAVVRISAPNFPNTDITVIESDVDSYEFVVDTNPVTVDEGGSATFGVRLSTKPSSNVTVYVNWVSGDQDITVGTSQLSFTPENWAVFQDVTVNAATDEDDQSGQAVITLSASGFKSADVTVMEVDSGTGEPPQIAIISPVNSATVYDDVTISVIATDDHGVERVEFYIDDLLVETDTDYPYRYVWPTKEESLGAHLIKAVAYDSIDQTADASIAVELGDQVPAVNELSVSGGSPSSGTVTVTIKAEDYRGVQQIDFYVDDVLVPSATWSGSPDALVSHSFQLDTTAYSNASHTFKAIATDTSSQTSTPHEKTVTIQN